jgi:alpha-tubulin suppressor-like RCC1 family protein
MTVRPRNRSAWATMTGAPLLPRHRGPMRTPPLVILLASACGTSGTLQPPLVTISPANPTTADDLTVSWRADLPEGAPEPEIRWKRNGFYQFEAEGPRVPAIATIRGDVWTAEVTVADGRRAPVTGSAEVAIANTAPTVTISLEPQAPRAGEALLATATVVDPDNDPITLTWIWDRNGGPTPFQDALIPVGTTRRDDVWTVAVTAADDEARSEPAVAQASVLNGRPALSNLLVTPARITVADAPSAEVTVADADGDPVVVSWAWRRGAELLSDTATLPAPATWARGDVLEVTANATDGVDPALPLSSGPLIVANALPALIDAPQISPATPTVTDTLRCTANTADADGDTVTPGAAWTQNGMPWSSEPAPSAATLRKHDLVGCTLTPDDGLDLGAPRDATPVEVQNSLPTLASASITPPFPSTDAFLGVVPGATDDADGDPITLRYAWYRGQQLLSTDRALDPQLTSRGDRVWVEVTPQDDEATGLPVVSAEVLIGDTPPYALDVTLTPAAPQGADPIIATPRGGDPDGDVIIWHYRWLRNGQPLDVPDSAILEPGQVVAGDLVAVEATPDDGQLLGPPVRSEDALVLDSPPTVLGVSVWPVEVREDTQLSCLVRGLADADGDPTTLSFAWLVNDVVVAGTSTLDGTSFNKGDRVRCAATPITVAATGREVTSVDVVVQNTPPILTSAELSPAAPRRGVDERVTLPPVYDPDPADADALRVSYAWTINGAPAPAAPVLAGTSFGRGDTIAVTVTPADPEGPGPSWTLGPATVVNAPPTITAIFLSPDPLLTETPAHAAVVADDADGDEVTLRATWKVNDVAVLEGSYTLDAAAFARGDRVWLEVTPTDGTDEGEVTSSAVLVVANTPPEAPSVTITPRWAVVGQDALRCTFDPTRDADSDGVTYQITWAVDGEPYPRPGDIGPGSQRWPLDTVNPADTGPGELWSCSVTPFDVAEAGPTAFAQASPVDVPLRGVSSGHWFSCALNRDDRVQCWGNNDDAQAVPSVPTATRLITAFNETCALDALGLPLCWGGNPLVTSFPFARFADLSLNLLHGCGVRTDHTLACWGDDVFGATAAPAGATFSQVAAGYAHTCARTLDGALSCWGLPVGTITDPPTTTGFTDLAAAAYFTCAIDAEGEVQCWGDTANVHPGPGPWRDLVAGVVNMCGIAEDDHLECWGEGPTEPPPEGTFLSVAPGAEHVCAVRTSGELVCWGSTLHGETNPPSDPLGAISAGVANTCAVREDGTPVCWGSPDYPITTPPDVTDLVSVRVGRDFACGLDHEGGISCWGDEVAPNLPPATRLAVGDQHACALTGADLVCWGADQSGQASPPTDTWVDVAAASDHTCGVTQGGQVWCWGLDAYGEASPPAILAVSVGTGVRNSCAVLTDNSLACWGDLATGVTTPPPGTWLAVDVGRAHACAIAFDGEVTCWGNDTFGQLHPPSDRFLEIDAGNDQTCGVTTAQQSRCWGVEVH